jgi:hypothetical protein
MTEINKYLQGSIDPITTDSSQETVEVLKIDLEYTNTETSENEWTLSFIEGKGMVYMPKYQLSHKYNIKQKDEEFPLFLDDKGVVWVSKRELIKSMLPDLIDLISACFWIGVICLLKPFTLVDKTLRKQLK